MTRTSGTGRAQSAAHLDMIRGCAALVVVTGHERGLFFVSPTSTATETRQDAPSPHPPAAAISIGAEAVMVFLVLSGYLVGGSVINLMKKDRWSWAEFLLRRLSRLWTVLLPALAITMLVDFAGYHFLAGAGGLYDAPAGQDYVLTKDFSQIWSPSIFLGNLFFVQTILTPIAGTNHALWSLCVEFWYYITFPMALLAFAARRTMPARIGYGAGAALILAVLGLHAAFLFLVWALGAAVAVAPLKLPRRAATAMTWLSPLVLAAAFVLVKKHIADPTLAEAAIALIFAAALYAMLHQRETCASRIYDRFASVISRFSYTLYLTHLPMLVFFCALVNRPWRIQPATPATLALFGLVLAATLGCAWLVYLAFEARTDHVRAWVGRFAGGRLRRFGRLQASFR